MRGRAWLIPIALLLVVAVLVLLVPNHPNSSPEHSSDSDAPDGTSALYELSSRLGHPTSRVKDAFSLGDSSGVLFVFSPLAAVSKPQAGELAQWVRDGGTLVYADTRVETSVRDAFGVDAAPEYVGLRPNSDGTAREAPILVTAPVLDGVDQLRSAPQVAAVYTPDLNQVPVLRLDDRERVVGILVRLGRGRAFFLGDPLPVCNGFLGKADNGRFAADVLAMAPPGAPVRFDEFHHRLSSASASVNDWVTTPWGAALGWALVVVFLGFFLRARPFGPRVAIVSTRERSSAEHATAVGALLRRARARELTLKMLSDAARRALAERTGLGRGVAPERLAAVLERRAPDLAGELRSADMAAAGAAGSDQALLEAARKLHSLAYPSAKK